MMVGTVVIVVLTVGLDSGAMMARLVTGGPMVANAEKGVAVYSVVVMEGQEGQAGVMLVSEVQVPPRREK